MAINKTNVNDVEKNYAKFDLALICEEKYKSLKHTDMVIYTMLKNQESLSIASVKKGKMNYVDSNGYIFIEISQKKLCKILKITNPTLKASLDRLEACELIENIQIGSMKCNRIYVGSTESTITLGEYITKIGIELEAEKEKEKEKVPTIKVTNKKDLSVGADKPNQKPSKNNNYDNSIPQNIKNSKEVNIKSETIDLINKSAVAIKKTDLKACEEEFKDLDRLALALKYCEDKEQNGIKALRLAYKNVNNEKENNVKTFKTKFHNVNDNFKKYDENKLNEIIEESQKDKFKDIEETSKKIRNGEVEGLFKPNF